MGDTKIYLFIYVKQKSRLHNSIKSMVFTSQGIHIFRTITLISNQERGKNSTLVFDNDP